MQKYSLLEKKYGESQIRIFLINCEAFKNVVNKNLNLFKKIIGNEITAV